MSATQGIGTNPYGDLLPKAKKLTDEAAKGSSAADKEKTPLEAASDEIAGRVYSVANGALRKTVIGPADVVVGPLLTKADDLIPRKIEFPPENVTPADQSKTFVDFFLEGFCEESHTIPDIGVSTISYANVALAQAIAQGLRDTLHICARPAEAISEGLQTEASVELIVNTIHTLPPETQKMLGLDTFAATLQDKVGGNPKALLSSLLQGTASVADNVARLIPESRTNREGANRSFTAEALLMTDIPIPTLVFPTQEVNDSLSSLGEHSGPTDGIPFNIPKGNPSLGGEHLSSSLDILLYADIPLPDLFLPNSQKDPSDPKQPAASQTPAPSKQRQQSSATGATGSRFPNGLKPQLSEDSHRSSDFDFRPDDRPPDFERFTGKLSVTLVGEDRQAELRSLANLCAYYKKNGWPKERMDYELKVRRNKVQHREDKLAGIQIDIKWSHQKGRVHQAFETLQQAEQANAKTGNGAHKISEAFVNYVVELELLNRFRAAKDAQKGGKAASGGAPKPPSGNKEKLPTASTPNPAGNGASSKNVEQDNPATPSTEGEKDAVVLEVNKATTPAAPLSELPTDADIQALEAEIKAIDVKIAGSGKEEKRAMKRVKRYKKWWRKVSQKFLHTVFEARKPGTVVDEETILATLNHEQKVALEQTRAGLASKLEELKNRVREKPPIDLSGRKIEKSFSEQKEPSAEEELQKTDADPEKPKDTQRDEQEKPPVEEEQSPAAAAAAATDDACPTDESQGGCLDALRKAKGKLQRTQEKAVRAAKTVEEYGDSVVRARHEQFFIGKKQFLEAKRLQKIADLIDKKLSQGGEGVSLKMKNGQEKSLTREQSQKLKAKVLRECAAKTDSAAKNIIDGSISATAGQSVKSAARCLGKRIEKIHLSSANALGSTAGAAVVDFGAHCIAEGKISGEEAGEAVKEVVCQTAKSVAKQVAQDVARSVIKGVVKEVAPKAAQYIPGVAAINSVLTIGSAALHSNSVGEAVSNGTSAAVDMGISFACAAAGQALIPIPFVGAFAGSAAGSLVIMGKNGAVSVVRSIFS